MVHIQRQLSYSHAWLFTICCIRQTKHNIRHTLTSMVQYYPFRRHLETFMCMLSCKNLSTVTRVIRCNVLKFHILLCRVYVAQSADAWISRPMAQVQTRGVSMNKNPSPVSGRGSGGLRTLFSGTGACLSKVPRTLRVQKASCQSATACFKRLIFQKVLNVGKTKRIA